MLCVHYAIDGNRADYSFRDDPRVPKQRPDAAESLNELLSHPKGWHIQLFKSKQSNVKSLLFRGLNSNGSSNKPLTQIVISRDKLPTERIRIYLDNNLVSFKNAPQLLWGLLGDLKKQNTDFRALRGWLPPEPKISRGDVDDNNDNLVLENQHSPVSESKDSASQSANLPLRNNRTMAQWFRSLSLLEMRRVIVGATTVSHEYNAKTMGEIFDSECLNVIAEKMVHQDVGDLDQFWSWPHKTDPIYKVTEAALQIIHTDKQLLKLFYHNMEKWLCAQSNERILDFITTLLGMCKEYDIFRLNLDEYVDRVISEALISIKPSKALVDPYFYYRINSFACDFCKLGFFNSPGAIVSLFLDDNYFLTNGAIDSANKETLEAIWRTVKTRYESYKKANLKENDPLYSDFCNIRKYQEYILKKGVFNKLN